MTHQIAVEVVRRPEYIIRYEQWADLMFVHVEILQWTISVAREFKHDLDLVLSLRSTPTYALGEFTDAKKHRFYRRHGFELVGVTFNFTGRLVPLYMRPPRRVVSR